MGNFYLDIETTGLYPENSKIITIQYQELGRNSGEAIGPLTILKEWESSEKEIISKIFAKYDTSRKNDFAFVATGFNLGFEHKFLIERAKANGLAPIDILLYPFVDLRAFAILINNGEFKGSSLDKVSGKKSSGSHIPEWYEKKEYGKIVEYIEDETKSFVHWNAWLYKRMPTLGMEYKKEIGKP